MWLMLSSEINQLRQAIRSMSRRSALYKALKEELSLLGYWKNKARGDSSKGWAVMKGRLAKG